MTALRIFLFGGLLSYRALFNWLRPAIYLPTMVGKPLFQIVFFTYLGRFSAVADDSYFIVGNAVQASVVASVFGMVMLLANEREFGTLSAILATPANRFAMFAGRAVAPIANGVFVTAFEFGAAFVILGFRMPPAAIPALAVTVLVTVASCAMFGMVLGSVGLRARDVWVGSNLAYALTLLLCGVNVPLSAMPPWLGAVGRAMPLTHGVQAAREVVAGAGLTDVSGLLGREALAGLVYGVLGYALLRYFEAESRRRATLELL